jgi:hypothetical protein
MERDPDAEYQKVLKFLGLAPYPLKDAKPKVQSKYSSSMDPETRKKLEQFFAPYNERLYEMLGGDWPGYWDSKDDTSRV